MTESNKKFIVYNGNQFYIRSGNNNEPFNGDQEPFNNNQESFDNDHESFNNKQESFDNDHEPFNNNESLDDDHDSFENNGDISANICQHNIKNLLILQKQMIPEEYKCKYCLLFGNRIIYSSDDKNEAIKKYNDYYNHHIMVTFYSPTKMDD